VLIALGSNVGDSVATLRRAVERLGQVVDVHRVSSFYRTEPMYVVDQPPFVNGAVLASAGQGPLGLLSELKRIEAELGRQARVQNGPREIDLDLIAYGSLILRSARVAVPHPRLGERRFVLAPVAEIAPDFVIPGLPPLPDLLKSTESQAASVLQGEDAALSI
jgi:2-amino-4-hydroxy-6-hydroxymethyldihydropteridine diphosphokinase